MASTQRLTELPTIQYTGMDYSTVISQIQKIIEENPKWKENWTQFYSSEAGTMLVQLMAWICDNLAVRQDLMYNESFLSTATNDDAKIRLLNQIGYIPQTTSAAIVPVKLEPNSNQEIITLKKNVKNDISKIKRSIISFKSADISGKLVNWELLPVNKDGTINWLEPMYLPKHANGNYYQTTNEESSTNKVLKNINAVQGETYYQEFQSNTANGPTFVIGNTDFDLKTLTVFDLSAEQPFEHKRVDSFMDEVFIDRTGEDKDKPCYVVERADNGSYVIRYPDSKLIEYNSYLKNHGFTAGGKIGILYRVSNGTDGNIPALNGNFNSYMRASITAYDKNNKVINITIRNELAGYGGEDGETIDESVVRAPMYIKTMDRCVTVEDFDKILERNSLVLKSKTFSPDNEPAGFKDFYGRRINPQEVFSIVALNKNVNNIPSDKLNNFPWIELNQETVANQQYSFGSGKLDQEVNDIPTVSRNIYFDSLNIDGDYRERENNKKQRFLRGARIFEYSLLRNELEKEDFKAKLSFKKSDEIYLNNIKNSFFNDDKQNDHYYTKENSKVEEETNAKIISKKTYKSSNDNAVEFSDNDAIDCFNFSKIKYVLDDNMTLETDLINGWKLKYINGGIEKTCDDTLEDFLSIVWPSDTNGEEKTTKFFIKPSVKNVGYINNLSFTNKQAAIDFYNSEKMSNYREGFIEKIGNTYKEKIIDQKGEKFEDCAEELKKTELTEEELIELAEAKETYTYNLDKNGSLESIIKKIEKDGEIKYYKYGKDREEFKDYTVAVQSARINDCIYQDIGLQFPGATLSNKFNEFSDFSEAEDVQKIFPFYTDYSYNNGEEYYSIDKIRNFYTIRINGAIYALRIDAFSIDKAKKFYENLKDDSKGKYYNFIPYIGRGKAYFDNILTNLSDNGKAAINKLSMAYNYTMLESATALFEETGEANKNTDAIYYFNEANGLVNYCYLTIDRLAALLNYLVSPLNNDKDLVYKLDNNEWKDIHEDDSDLILDGKLYVELAERQHYNYNYCDTNYYNFEEDLYKNFRPRTEEKSASWNKEYDLRFGWSLPVKDSVLTIESTNVESLPQIPETETETEPKTNICDFFKKLLKVEGKKYKSEIYPHSEDAIKLETYSDNDAQDSSELRIKVSSCRKGNSSSLYFLEKNKDNSALNNFIGVDYFNSIYEDDEYNKYKKDYEKEENYYSEKSFGLKRMELIFENTNYNNSSIYGDILVTENDINYTSSNKPLYISYASSDTNNDLHLDKQDDFYYSADSIVNDKAKEKTPIYGIEGTVYYEQNKKTYIDRYLSNLEVKITSEKVDTNNYYAIEKDEKFNSIKVDRIYLPTKVLGENEMFDEGMSLQYYIDVGDLITDQDISKKVSTEEFKNLNNLYDLIIKAMNSKNEPVDNYTNATLSKQKNMLVRKSKSAEGSLILSNFLRDKVGNITFVYPKKENGSYTVTDVQSFYKAFLGTNKTNKELYDLYPREMFKTENVIDDNGEYYYCPTEDSNLKFTYRTMVNNVSESGDYYIRAENISENNIVHQEFYLCKTEDSKFPDKEVYIHLLKNNEAYYKSLSDNNQESSEENVLRKYLKQYCIAGTDIHFLKPYFKTFDIEAKVTYSSNFEEAVIRKSIFDVFDKKYKVHNTKNIDVGNKIYLSNIINDIHEAHIGIKSVFIDYFGYDNTDKTTYPSQENVLTVDSKHDFYTMSVLADNTNDHGLILNLSIDE